MSRILRSRHTPSGRVCLNDFDRALPPHAHRETQLIVAVAGTLRVRVAGDALSLAPYRAVRVDSLVPHDVGVVEGPARALVPDVARSTRSSSRCSGRPHRLAGRGGHRRRHLVAGSFDTRGAGLGYLRARPATGDVRCRSGDTSASGRPSSADVSPHLIAPWQPRGAAAVFGVTTRRLVFVPHHIDDAALAEATLAAFREIAAPASGTRARCAS